jgi:hypothetical protein
MDDSRKRGYVSDQDRTPYSESVPQRDKTDASTLDWLQLHLDAPTSIDPGELLLHRSGLHGEVVVPPAAAKLHSPVCYHDSTRIRIAKIRR